MSSNHPRRLKGILFYPMEVDHVVNKRVRLLLNDHGSDGYWIWSCLVDQAYKVYGYFYPVTGDDIDLFSADVCRKPPEFVWDVIGSCVKRGLFDKNVFDKCSVLTNDRMQLNFIRGTFERRRKGATVYLNDNHFIIHGSLLHEIEDKYSDKIVFTPSGKNLPQIIVSDVNTIFSGVKPDISAEKELFTTEKQDFTLLEESRVEESRVEESIYLPVDSDESSGEKNGSVGVKSKNGHEISKLAKKGKTGRAAPENFQSPQSKLGYRIRVAWVEWFQKRNNGVGPKFGAAEGSAISKLSNYFISQSLKKDFAEEKMIYDDAFDSFSLILSRWSELSTNNYLYGCVDIKKINSNITDIINFLNNGRGQAGGRINQQGNKPGTSDARIEAARNF